MTKIIKSSKLKSSMPQVSVIIPTYNRPHLLLRAIESALCSGSNVEVVVVDDASNDDTAQVCQTLEGIKYIRLDLNQGVAGARNVGILNSKGDYITFLDDDDVRINKSLDLQVEALASMPEAGLIYGQALIANQQGHAGADYYPQRCSQGDVFWEL
ncbi:MAG: glycosyltransferase family 2 protein, partial [Acidobacteria bacterium]|nr:glycosyltransferase family 2 protein [Acidobacteriota bacterium]